MIQTALLVCNGEPPSRKLAQRLARGANVIVAADGGANSARRLGIRPDIIIGDLDSITATTTRFFSVRKRLKPSQNFPGGVTPRPAAHAFAPSGRKGRGTTQFMRVQRQDNTDLEKALDVLREQHITRVTIIAATGKRIDHTLGNLSVIWKYTKNISLTFVSDGWCAMPVGKKENVAAEKGTTVSLVPFGACSGITLRGLTYPLTNATMKVGEIGVSNVVKRSPFTVEVKRGKMLMVILADHNSVCATNAQRRHGERRRTAQQA